MKLEPQTKHDFNISNVNRQQICFVVFIVVYRFQSNSYNKVWLLTFVYVWKFACDWLLLFYVMYLCHHSAPSHMASARVCNLLSSPVEFSSNDQAGSSEKDRTMQRSEWEKTHSVLTIMGLMGETIWTGYNGTNNQSKFNTNILHSSYCFVALKF